MAPHHLTIVSTFSLVTVTMSSTDKFCPHCDHHVSARTFRRHKQLYCINGTWERHSSSSDESNDSSECILGPSEGTEDAEEIITDHGSTETDEPNVFVDGISKEVLSRFRETVDDTDIPDLQDDVTSAAISAEDISADDMHVQDTFYDRVPILGRWFAIVMAHWIYVHNIPNNALQQLLKFFNAFLTVICNFFPPLKVLVQILPGTLYTFLKASQTNEDRFIKYVVCTKCNTLRLYSECFGTNGKPILCTFVKYPNHRMKTMRQPCDNTLLKEMRTKRGIIYYPRSVFCYNSLIASLKEMTARPNFLTLCNHWRTWQRIPGTYRDVYDGRVWRELIDNDIFLQAPGDLTFTLNLDWFQPFKNSTYSVGAIYMTINNLPRNVRYKRENIVFVSVLPGPSEPNPSQLLSYMKPLVNDLLELWEPGIDCRTEEGNTVRVRGMLICCACDIPAARKLCGFLGHSAKQGCHRCHKQFVTGRTFSSIKFN